MENNYDALYDGCKIYVVSEHSYDIDEFIVDSINIIEFVSYITNELEKTYSVKYHNGDYQLSSWKIHGTFFMSIDEAKCYIERCCKNELNEIYERTNELNSILTKIGKR